MALLLQQRGYRATALRGGFGGWRDAGLPLVPVAAPRGPGPDAARLVRPGGPG